MEIVKITPDMFLKSLMLDQYSKGYTAVNPVYSGFNQAMKTHFGVDPITYTQGLKDQGLIEISGRKSTTNGRERKSVILYLTEKGMTHFGIRPPTAQKVGPSAIKKVDKLIEAAQKRFSVK
jgi:hypothetical protein